MTPQLEVARMVVSRAVTGSKARRRVLGIHDPVNTCLPQHCPVTCCPSRHGKEAQDWTTKHGLKTTSSYTPQAGWRPGPEAAAARELPPNLPRLLMAYHQVPPDVQQPSLPNHRTTPRISQRTRPRRSPFRSCSSQDPHPERPDAFWLPSQESPPTTREPGPMLALRHMRRQCPRRSLVKDALLSFTPDSAAGSWSNTSRKASSQITGTRWCGPSTPVVSIMDEATSQAPSFLGSPVPRSSW